jgi:hypothetical protein
MQAHEGEVRSQAKKRLTALLKAAAGGVVIAAVTVATPNVNASVVTPAEKPALEERVQQVRDRNAGDVAKTTDTLEEDHHHHWGNHWDNWHNWNNWHNWHNW